MILRALLRALPFVLLLGATGGLVVGMTTGDGLRLDILDRVSPPMLVLAVFLGFFPWAMDSVRLHLWAGVLDSILPLRSALRVVIGADLGSAVTPTAVGGIPVKVALLREEGVPAATGASLCALKAFEDGAFFVVAIPVALVFTAGSVLPLLASLGSRVPVPELILAGIGGAALTGGVAWSGRRSRLAGMIVANGALVAKAGARRFALSFLYTAFQWVARYSAITALAAGLGVPVEPVRFWLLQWVVFTAMTLVPTPGAAGGAEAAFALAYGGILPAELMTWLMLGWRAVTFYLLVGVGSAIFALLEVRRRRGPPPLGNREGPGQGQGGAGRMVPRARTPGHRGEMVRRPWSAASTWSSERCPHSLQGPSLPSPTQQAQDEQEEDRPDESDKDHPCHTAKRRRPAHLGEEPPSQHGPHDPDDNVADDPVLIPPMTNEANTPATRPTRSQVSTSYVSLPR